MDATHPLTADQILQTLADHTAALRQLGVVRIGLFGSRVRGEARPDSDIDVLVRLADTTFDTYCKVLLYLEDLFQTKIDLVPAADLKPRIRPQVLDEVQYVRRVGTVV